MNPHPVSSRIWSVLFGTGLAGIVWLFLSGCTTAPLRDPIFGESYQPQNIYAAWEVIPLHLKRVAVLPLTALSGDRTIQAGQEALEPMVPVELIKSGRFEVVFVTREELSRWTGRPQWEDTAELPADFFQTLRAQTGCDGVLLAQLTEYRPYQPLAIGWRLKLVDAEHRKIVWGADELFNAGHPAVSNGARRYYWQHMTEPPALADSRSILRSPRSFGQYTLGSLFEALPQR